MTRHSALLLALFALSGCGSGGTSATTALVRIDGSSTVFPVTEAVAEEFQKSNTGVRVTVGVSGTGGGFQKFCRGETDVSNASRPIKAVELDACRKAGIEFFELPVAYDGLVVVVNPRNSWVSAMTVDDLRTLWQPSAERTVLRWNQIRPEWPDREVHLFGAGVDSGTFDYFTEAIVGKEDASRGDYTSSEDDNVIVQGVARDELALGYFGFAYYQENRDTLKVVPIDDGREENGKGPVTPSLETVRDGTYQPLSRPLFLYVSKPSMARPEVRAFIDYYLREGPALAREVGYLPLTDKEYALVASRLEKGSTGTMFEGGSQVGVRIETLLSEPSK